MSLQPSAIAPTLGDKENTGGILKENASRKHRLLFSVRRIREWGLKVNWAHLNSGIPCLSLGHYVCVLIYPV